MNFKKIKLVKINKDTYVNPEMVTAITIDTLRIGEEKTEVITLNNGQYKCFYSDYDLETTIGLITPYIVKKQEEK